MPDDDADDQTETTGYSRTAGWRFIASDHEQRASLRAAGFRSARILWDTCCRDWQQTQRTLRWTAR